MILIHAVGIYENFRLFNQCAYYMQAHKGTTPFYIFSVFYNIPLNVHKANSIIISSSEKRTREVPTEYSVSTRNSHVDIILDFELQKIKQNIATLKLKHI